MSKGTKVLYLKMAQRLLALCYCCLGESLLYCQKLPDSLIWYFHLIGILLCLRETKCAMRNFLALGKLKREYSSLF